MSHRLTLGGKAERSDTVDPTIIVKLVRCDVRERYYRARIRKELKHLTTRDMGFTRITEQKMFHRGKPDPEEQGPVQL